MRFCGNCGTRLAEPDASPQTVETSPGDLGVMMGADLMCLLDCYAAGSYGGSGKAFDWSVAREATQRFPVMVAGGLSPQNVGEAMRLARPWGVDVSSGVESDGVKDILRIKAFIEAVRQADRALVEELT